MALSCTLPLQEAAVRALPTPFHSPLEDKETGDKKRERKEQRASPFSHEPQPWTAIPEMLMHFISALYGPKELPKASIANIGSSRSK